MIATTSLCPASGYVSAIDRRATDHMLARWAGLAVGGASWDASYDAPEWKGCAGTPVDAAVAALLDLIPRLHTVQQIADWATCVIDAARAKESDNAPRAEVRFDRDAARVGWYTRDSLVDPGDRSLRLTWAGTYTPGRHVDLEVWTEPTGLGIRLVWDTGTGEPSTFLAGLVPARAWLDDWSDTDA